MYFLRWDSKVSGGCLVQIPKAYKDMVGINKIAKSLKADGPKKIKSGGTSPQRA